MVAPALPVEYALGYVGRIGKSLKIYKIVEVKLSSITFKKAVLIQSA